jgi:phage gp36-like protein
MNSYTTPTKYLEWMPDRYIAELSADNNGFSADTDVVQLALNWAEGMMESKLMVRDDIPIPAVNADGTVPDTLRECVHDLATYRLFDRRGTMNQQVQTKFDIQMTWLNQVADNKAGVAILDSDGKSKTQTNRQPVIDGDQERIFDDFTV